MGDETSHVDHSSSNGIWALDPLRDDRWLELVSRHPQGSVFHTRGWLNALQTTYGYEPIAFTTCSPGDPLTTAVPCCIVRSWLTGTRLVSLPFSDHCEPLVDSPEQFTRLCVHLETLRVREGWKYVEIRTSDPRLEFGTEFSQANTYVLHRLDLRPSLDRLRRGVHKDCIQRKIARAEREALRYESGRTPQLLQQLYRLLKLTRSRHQLPPQPFEWFENVVTCLGKDACIRIAFKGETAIAGILTLDHGKTMVYKYGGSDARFNNLGATPMLFWHAITEAKDAGMEELDLGRSDLDNAGLIAFKDRWSAARSSLTNWRVPAVQGNHSREQLKVRLVQQACSWIPDKLLNMAGRLLYRHIG